MLIKVLTPNRMSTLEKSAISRKMLTRFQGAHFG
jgi:hypothetical protein